MGAVAQQLTTRMLVVGAGASGLSCVRYLQTQGCEVVVLDTRSAPPGLDQLHTLLPAERIFLGNWPDAAFVGVDQIVVSPGLSLDEPALRAAAARGVPLLGDIELFARAAAHPVLAITGSNGKSTVTTLVGALLEGAGRRVAVGGNLGTPALDLLARPAPDAYVLELSSFQLERTHSLRPAGACVLNLSADHLDRHGSFAAYSAAKASVLTGATVAVLNRDDPAVAAMADSLATNQPVIWFGLGTPHGEADFGLIEVAGKSWLARGTSPLLPVAALRLPGRHNIANALAALALVDALGVPVADVLEALAAFAGLPHRTQWLGDHAGLAWYNDSKGTNVGATLAALEGLAPQRPSQRLVLILGGQGKGQDFAPLRAALARHGRAAVLIGEAADSLDRALAGVVPTQHATDMHAAVATAAALAQPGDGVLLSPACASFDMFAGYADRGEAFAGALRAFSRGVHDA
ncbi:MAG: UDP-N-acetylmuramoyl-L-alanine--D-glutamate ligase [Immundisolibacter sp.]|uniref:UDP-N-acetylmuramoyl-L-alanine--D-glutamate ligase n=1 Tax=Immundisolibacter sp. TaxID=1934948 RepID=UPI003EE33665